MSRAALLWTGSWPLLKRTFYQLGLGTRVLQARVIWDQFLLGTNTAYFGAFASGIPCPLLMEVRSKAQQLNAAAGHHQAPFLEQRFPPDREPASLPSPNLRTA